MLVAANRLGYAPNASARSLRLRRTQQIGLAVPDIPTPSTPDLMRAVADVVEAAGYRFDLHSTAGRRAYDEDVVRTISDPHADGLILVSLRGGARVAQAVKHSRSPVVLVGESVDVTSVDIVRVDSTAAARMAVEHLVEAGRVRIGFLGADGESRAGAARLRRLRSPDGCGHRRDRRHVPRDVDHALGHHCLVADPRTREASGPVAAREVGGSGQARGAGELPARARRPGVVSVTAAAVKDKATGRF